MIMNEFVQSYETLIKEEENFYRLYELNEQLIKDYSINIWENDKYNAQYREIDYHKRMNEVDKPFRNLNLIYYVVFPLILLMIFFSNYRDKKSKPSDSKKNFLKLKHVEIQALQELYNKHNIQIHISTSVFLAEK